MRFELFWKPQDLYNERARVGFWAQTQKRLVHFALTWYTSPCILKCFVFKRSAAPFKYAFSLAMGSLQAMLHYDERTRVQGGPTGPTGPTGCTGVA